MSVYDAVQLLPLEELYAPPINITVRDNRQFGRKPVVGVHAVKSLQLYRRQPAAAADTQSDADQPRTTGQTARPLMIAFLLGTKGLLTAHKLNWSTELNASVNGRMYMCWELTEH